MRSRSLLSTLWCVGIAAGLASTATPAAAESTLCALRVLRIVPQDRVTYVVRVHSTSVRAQDITLTLFSAGVRYTAVAAAVRFIDPGPQSLPRAGAATYPVRSVESEDFTVRLPLPDDLIGARIEGDGRCAAPFIYTPVVQEILGSHPLPEQVFVGTTRRAPAAAVAVELLPKLECETPYARAELARAEVPDYPAIAAQQGARGSVYVSLTIGSDGSVFPPIIVRPSGHSALDRSALRAAGESGYDPAVFRCGPVAGELTVRADFSVRNFLDLQTQLSAQ